MIKVGDLVKVAERGRALLTVEDVSTDEETGKDWIITSGDDGSFGQDYELSAATLVMTAKDAAKRRIPTASEILDALSIVGMHDDFDINESDREGEDGLSCYGKTRDGLRFAFLIRVSDVGPSD